VIVEFQWDPKKHTNDSFLRKRMKDAESDIETYSSHFLAYNLDPTRRQFSLYRYVCTHTDIDADIETGTDTDTDTNVGADTDTDVHLGGKSTR